ncbi:MAG: tetratricopeptide repeat protein [Planctomycetota bacterium]|jgi:tetratricopeptide (TPR) repeat protein|nr:tetratricopeptide repeat protein [Planctomycetota bacterium]
MIRPRVPISAAFPLLALFAAIPPAPAAAPGGLAEMGRLLLDLQSFLRGDRDGVVRFALAATQEFQGTPLAELAARLALQPDLSLLSAVNVGEAETRRLLDSGTGLSPGSRDALRRFLARALAAGGRRDEALELHRRRGLAMSWLIAGPFYGRRGASPVSPGPPEAGGRIGGDVVSDPPGEATFAEWRRRPPWRPLPENRSFPFVRPWRWPEREGTGAMLMFTGLVMEAPDDQAVLHLYSDVSWRLYVDGRLAAEVNKNGAEEPVEHLVSYPLAAGTHAVLLHLLPPRPDAGANAARTALRLESTASFSWDRNAIEPGRFKAESARREARRLEYFTDLQALLGDDPAVARRESAIFAAIYALACGEQGMGDGADWWMGLAARADPDNPALKVMAGVLTAANPLLPPERRRDLAAARHREALGTNPDIVPSLLFLAALDSDAGREREAYLSLEKAGTANPAGMDILLARAAWFDRFASAASARAAWDECARAFPDSPAVQLAVASAPGEWFLDMDRRLAASRAAAEAGPYLIEASLQLARALADSGNSQEAGYVLRGAEELFAGDSPIMRGIAEVYARLALYPEAIKALSEAVRQAPDNPDLWRRLGDFHSEAGEPEAARKFWKTSLAADPGQFDLADMVAALDREPDPFRAGEGYDAIALTAGADVKSYPGDVVRLLDRSEIIFAADGSHRRLTHEIDLARNRRGGEALAGITVRGEIINARVVFPNGNTLEPEPFPGQAGLRLPVIGPGAARELKFLESVPVNADEIAAIPPWFFQDVSGRVPFLFSEYIVRVPPGLALNHVVRNLGSRIRLERSRLDGFDVLHWTAEPSLPSREPDAVHISERVPSVEIGIKTTWDEVAFREEQGLQWRLAPSRRMRSLLESLTQIGEYHRPDPELTAKAIYRYVCDNILANPSGEMAAHVQANRMGDRRLLLLSLLQAALFDARPAAARPNPRFLHPPAWELPSMGVFTVPLVRLAIPGGATYWLDTRFDFLPFGELADDLSGATVMACLPDGSLFATLPELPARNSLVSRDTALMLPDAPGVSMTVSGRILTRGVAGLRQRQLLAQAGPVEREQLILQLVFPVFPDAAISHQEAALEEAVTASCDLRYKLESRQPLEARPGGALAVPLCLSPSGIISPETRNLSRRRTACHISEEHVAEDRNTFILPLNTVFTRLPRPARIPSRFGFYQLRVLARSDNRLEIIRDYHVPAQRILPWEWSDFLTFLDQIDLAERQWLEYEGRPAD